MSDGAGDFWLGIVWVFLVLLTTLACLSLSTAFLGPAKCSKNGGQMGRGEPCSCYRGADSSSLLQEKPLVPWPCHCALWLLPSSSLSLLVSSAMGQRCVPEALVSLALLETMACLEEMGEMVSKETLDLQVLYGRTHP